MKSFLIVILFIGCLFCVSCRNDEPGQNESQSMARTKADVMNQNRQAGDNPVARVEQGAQTSAAPSGPGDNANQTIKPPPFLDMAKGGIVDLPAPANTQLVSIQHGPINGAASALLIYEAGEPFATVTAYYDGVVKRQGWKVGTNIREPENIEMNLFKGERDEAILKISISKQTKRTQIMISRTQRPSEAKPQ